MVASAGRLEQLAREKREAPASNESPSSAMDYRGLGYIVLHVVTDTAAYVIEETFVDRREVSFGNVVGRVLLCSAKHVFMLNIGYPYVIDPIKAYILPKKEKSKLGVVTGIVGDFFLGCAIGSGARYCSSKPYDYEKTVATALMSGVFDGIASCVEAASLHAIESYEKAK